MREIGEDKVKADDDEIEQDFRVLGVTAVEDLL